MGIIASTLTSCVASCIGSCAGSAVCATANAVCGKQGSTQPHLVLFTLVTIVAIILRYQNSGIIHLYTFSYDACDTSTCVGYGAVFRLSFALFLYFALHALILSCQAGRRIDHIGWTVKAVVLVAIIIGVFAIPPVFYNDAWVNIARFGSFFFLFCQIVILIDFAYTSQEYYTSDERPYHALVFISSVIFFCGSIVLWAFYFIWFGGASCPRNETLISVTIILSVIVSAISISPIADPKGGLLPAATITLYATWLAYSALESDPSSCNSLSNGDTLHLILGLIVGALSLIYAAWNVSTSNSLFGGADAKPVEYDHEAAVDSSAPTPAIMSASPTASTPVTAPPVSAADEANDDLIASRNWKFHLLMMSASMYEAMLLTNWGSAQQADATADASTAYDQGVESLWIKFATQWLALITFCWTLVNHRVCSDREFA